MSSSTSNGTFFNKVLVANRGEIACRVFRTAKRLGIGTVAVYSEADARALHVREADESVLIGPAAAAESYLVIEKIIEACKATGADAVHPGYGFLSERAAFAEALAAEGIAFVGPPAGAIEAMGDKITSKRIADEAGVSTVPGEAGIIEDADAAVAVSTRIGFPVMLKASAGGGGKGMRVAWNEDEAREGFERARSEAASSFGDDRIFIEKFVTEPRHIEIQVLCDSHGNGVYLGERECSIQRRNQKVIEEAPSPFLDEPTRRAMGEQALKLARAVNYASAGTVEFIVDEERKFYFLEMNTRLQVEHPVTELITGVDLVEQMLRVAAGERLTLQQSDISLNGWAVESRLYAEDPYRGFLPSVGRLTRYRPPLDLSGGRITVRNDTGVDEGGEISRFYDPMIAKLCTYAPTRPEAVSAMASALDTFEIEGIAHNLPFLSAVMRHPRFIEGRLTTAFIDDEYPDGFSGVAPDTEQLRLHAAIATVIYLRDQAWRQSVGPERLKLAQQDELVACLGEQRLIISDVRDHEAVALQANEQPMNFTLDWQHGARVARAKIAGQHLDLRVSLPTGGVRLRGAGMDLNFAIGNRRLAELRSFMPIKSADASANALLCPMPGLLTKVLVAEGDRVEPGQSLAVVEAMKMENTLSAERTAVIKTIVASEGASLAVDEVIIEFEEED